MKTSNLLPITKLENILKQVDEQITTVCRCLGEKASVSAIANSTMFPNIIPKDRTGNFAFVFDTLQQTLSHLQEVRCNLYALGIRDEEDTQVNESNVRFQHGANIPQAMEEPQLDSDFDSL